ncbi:hypothetical protein L486_07721 [Kwoniella mangroviensis CBS 10435]|uniref:Major facilitator superfamily (MFS) profile domain-containing protein n=1 Tax=Kwoniella mangroviensis CBS 10435 TaxID=1331196 RepID=A0A1B9IG03_9TREE|nr:hypothetical protein L486_07721 [Kwoniella mangroviensis CBS 10435]
MELSSRELPIPGSVVLVDKDGHQTQHAEGRHNTDVVLSPKPSNDVNDPLRWSWKRKQLAHWMLVVYVMTNGIALCSLYSVLSPVSEATGISLGTLNAGTGYTDLPVLGYGGLITQPLAMMFGKRPMYLISQLGTVAVVIWMAFIKSESEWLANKVIQGLFASPIEMLVEVSIADIFYAHERGFYVGVYGMTLFGSNFLAPIWAGFVNDALGYKWVFYISAIQCAVGTVIMFFLMEETNYNRGTSELVEEHDGSAQTDTERPALYRDKQSNEKDLPSVQIRQTSPESRSSLTGTPYSYVRRLRMFDQIYCSTKMGWTMIWRPIVLLRFPVILWSGFLYGSALVWYNVLNATASILFTDLYDFSASAVGLVYFGPLVGSAVAALWSGWVGDRFTMWMTRRQNGVREPEYRLWLLTLNAIICPVGLILWGVGAAKNVHWMGLIFGGGMVAFTSASGGATAINYAIDSYKDLSSEVILAVVLVRNSMGFAIGYGITPWLDSMGYQNTFITAAMIGLAAYVSFLPVVRWGKSWRKASRELYWKYVEEGVLGH